MIPTHKTPEKEIVATAKVDPIRYWLWFVVFILTVVILLTFKDYGASWDEDMQSAYGELVLRYFSSFFHDKQCNFLSNLRLYGPIFELFSALVYSHADGMKFEIRHLLSALTGVMAVVGLIKYSRFFNSRLIPFFSSVALVTMPRFYGHWFINSKDIPFAATFVWAIYFVTRLFTNKTFRWREVWICGLFMGLASATRPAGFFLLLFYFSSCACFTAMQNGPKLPQLVKSTGGLPLLLIKVGSIFVTAWVVMVAFWPWTHESVIINPLTAIWAAAHFSEHMPVLFEGVFTQSDQLPWRYLPKYLLITIPIATIAFTAVGLFACSKAMLKNFRSAESTAIFMALLWLLFPVAYFIVSRPNIYDGMRHFLFILPPVALLAGIGANYAVSVATDVKWRAIAFITALACLLLPVKDMVALHPYQMTYFNSLAGGLKGAYRHYETDYWGTSYKEAVEWVNEKSKLFPDRKTRVLVIVSDIGLATVSYYANPDISMFFWTNLEINLPEALPGKYDFLVATTRFNKDKSCPGTPVVHTIGRQGAVFSVVKSPHKFKDVYTSP